MRYYEIKVTDPATGEVLVPNHLGMPGFTRVTDSTATTWSSLLAGASPFTPGGTNRAAQRIEFDIPVSLAHQPMQNSFFRVYGVGLGEIGQAADLNGMNVAVFGGMAVGLPLANPAQAQLLASGQVFQSFGNWVGVDQSLDVYMIYAGSSPSSDQVTGVPPTTSTIPAPVTNESPANFVFQWAPGQGLLTPLVSTLQVAFPKYRIAGQVNSNLVWSGSPATGFFSKLSQLAEFVHKKSLSIIAGYAPDQRTYPGVSISLANNTIIISDNSIATNPKQIEYVSLIGQPTWLNKYQVQISCVLRGDISVLDYVTLPQGPGIIQQDSGSQYFGAAPGDQYSTAKSASIFSGTFQVMAMRHVADSQQADAQSWITTLDLRYMQAPSSTVDALPVLYSGNNAFNFHLP